MDKKRLLSAMIATTMLIGTIPTYAFAADEEELPEQTVQETAETVDEPLAEDVILPESEDTTPEDEPAAPVEETDQATETPEETTEPEATEPEVTEPEVTEPEVTEEAPAEPEEEPVPETEEAVEVQAESDSLIAGMSIEDTAGKPYESDTNGSAIVVSMPNETTADLGTISFTTSEQVEFVTTTDVPGEDEENVLYVEEGGADTAVLALKLRISSTQVDTYQIDLERVDATHWKGTSSISTLGANIGQMADELGGRAIRVVAGMVESASGDINSAAEMRVNKDAANVQFVMYPADLDVHTVTYDCGVTYQFAVPDGSYAIKATAAERSGMKFIGWYTQEEDGTEFDFTQPITEDVTIYAHYENIAPASSFAEALDAVLAGQEVEALPIQDTEDFTSFVARADEVPEDQLVELTGDIDLGGATYTAIVGFKGDLNGNNYSISDATFTASGENSGMFAVIGDGQTIANLTLENITVKNGENAGVLAGTITAANGDSGTGPLIQNVHVKGGSVTGRNMGGLVGYTFLSTIQYCSVDGTTVSGLVNAGGIAGLSYSKILNCYAKNSPFAIMARGGIVAKNLETGVIQYCWTTQNAVSGHQDQCTESNNVVSVLARTPESKFTDAGFSEAIWDLGTGFNTTLDPENSNIKYQFGEEEAI